MKKLLIGYRAAHEYTGVPVRRLVRYVAARSIRVIKPNEKSVMFRPEHLEEDLNAMAKEKI
jgi:hypothetical protein